VSWALARDTIYIRTRTGVEGQGLRLALSGTGDSVVGRADWGWSTFPLPRALVPVRGARRPCPWGAAQPAHDAVVARRPPEWEGIYLDCGRRRPQLKRDSL